MIVTLMRHYRVRFDWQKSYTPQGYRAAMRAYDSADVIDQSAKLSMDYQRIFISVLPRTMSTLVCMKGDAPHSATSLLNEVPMEPFTERPREYSLYWLNMRARMQWMLNSPRQPETRERTVARANEFIERYLIQDTTCLVIGHGFFPRVLSQELLKNGFEGKPIIRLNNGEQITYQKKV